MSDLQKLQDLQLRLYEILSFISEYGDINGEHYKEWVLDQVVRKIYNDDSKYKDWVLNHCFVNGPDMPFPDDVQIVELVTATNEESSSDLDEEEADYSWSTGVSP